MLLIFFPPIFSAFPAFNFRLFREHPTKCHVKGGRLDGGDFFERRRGEGNPMNQGPPARASPEGLDSWKQRIDPARNETGRFAAESREALGKIQPPPGGGGAPPGEPP